MLVGEALSSHDYKSLSCDERISSRKGGDSSQKYRESKRAYSLMINKLASNYATKRKGDDSTGGEIDTFDFMARHEDSL